MRMSSHERREGLRCGVNSKDGKDKGCGIWVVAKTEK